MRYEEAVELGLPRYFNPDGEEDLCPECGCDPCECPPEPPCNHPSKIGDNYGVTCMDCGQHLEGYGHYGKGGNPCRHGQTWRNDEGLQVCVYCEREVTP